MSEKTQKPPFRERWQAMGRATLAGERQGWFIPYRYAGTVAPLDRYAVVERVFDAARPAFIETLESVAACRDALLAIPADDENAVPRWRQDWFAGLDAAVLYAMVRRRRPKLIVEVGSGHSTRFMVRALADGGLDARLVAIDPAPRADLAGQPIELVREVVQRADRSFFAALGPGDILSVDSSHVLMPGSDVDLVFNEIVPQLAPGVLVHIHDIFLPFAYPEDWALRGYNEQNAAALMISSGLVRPLFASHDARRRLGPETERLAGFVPVPIPVREASFWGVRGDAP